MFSTNLREKISFPKYFVFFLPQRRLSCFSVLYSYPIRRWVSVDETKKPWRSLTLPSCSQKHVEKLWITFWWWRRRWWNHQLMMMSSSLSFQPYRLCWCCVRFGGLSSGAVADGGVSVVSLSQERTTIRPTTCWERKTPQCAWRPVSANTTRTMGASCSTAHSRRE